MSYVIGLAAPNTAAIMSDGRALDQNGNIQSEEYRKVKKLTDKIIMGFAGDIASVNRVNDMLGKLILTNTTTADYIADKVYNCLSNNGDLKKAGFIISGISSKNDMVTYAFGLKSGRSLEPIHPTGLTLSNLVPTDYIGNKNIIAELILSGKYCDHIDAMKEAIFNMSLQCHSVNNHTFLEVISL